MSRRETVSVCVLRAVLTEGLTPGRAIIFLARCSLSKDDLSAKKTGYFLHYPNFLSLNVYCLAEVIKNHLNIQHNDPILARKYSVST